MNKRGRIAFLQILILVVGVIVISYAIGIEMKVVKGESNGGEVPQGYSKIPEEDFSPKYKGTKELYWDNNKKINKFENGKMILLDETKGILKEGTSASTDTAIKNIGESMIYALVIWGLVETFGGMFGEFFYRKG